MRTEGYCRTGGSIEVDTLPYPTTPVVHHHPSPMDRLAAPDPTDREVRSWASLAGVACPRVGRVPRRVRDQFLAKEAS